MDRNELPDFIRRLLGIDDNTPEEWRDVRELDGHEQEEWNSLHAEMQRLNDAADRLLIERKAYEARMEMFWFNVRHSRRHPQMLEEHLRVMDGMLQEDIYKEAQ